MPCKNVLKPYIKEGYYHIYNRGVEKRTIFIDDQDYKVFLNYLKIYLESPKKPESSEIIIGPHRFMPQPILPKNFYQQIELLAYCLMPNHFHLLIKQESARSIESFMRALATKYSVYFNKRYDRIGSLFQGPYKAVLIDKDDYLLHLTRYIHLNPVPDVKDSPLRWPFSSYADYLGKRQTAWIKPQIVLAFFKTAQRTSLADILSYQSFVEDYQLESATTINELVIDSED